MTQLCIAYIYLPHTSRTWGANYKDKFIIFHASSISVRKSVMKYLVHKALYALTSDSGCQSTSQYVYQLLNLAFVGTNPLIDYIPMYRVMVFFWIVFGLAFAFSVISFLKKLWMKPGKRYWAQVNHMNKWSNPLQTIRVSSRFSTLKLWTCKLFCIVRNLLKRHMTKLWIGNGVDYLRMAIFDSSLACAISLKFRFVWSIFCWWFFLLCIRSPSIFRVYVSI